MHRDVMAVTVGLRADASRQAPANKAIRDNAEAVRLAVPTIDGDGVYWGGPGTALIADTAATISQAQVMTAAGSVRFEVAIDRAVIRERGPLEARLTRVLLDAGLPVTDSADRGEFVVIRDIGADADPRYDSATVWCAVPVESGRVSALGRQAWDVLYASNVGVPGGYGVELGTTGIPGCVFPHDVAAIAVRGARP